MGGKEIDISFSLSFYVRTQQRGFIKRANIDVRGNSVSRKTTFASFSFSLLRRDAPSLILVN